jgi:hypothetical protein
MNDCTCTNCIFIDNNMRYCYDCEQYTKMPPREEFERRIEEAGRRLHEVNDENEQRGRGVGNEGGSAL